MKLKKLQFGVIAFAMTAVMAFSAVPEAFAAEEAENMDVESVETGEEGAAPEGAPDENGNPAEGGGQGGVVMSGIASNNGREIASQFPEEYIPEGFHKSTCTYEGQTIEIAYMDKGNGEVVLAYLADSDGSNGDFYLCDINTAEMSDFVQIYGGEGKYIIVLDPRDMVVAPAGFTKANLQWYGKSVSAWLLPGDGEPGGSKAEKDNDGAKAKPSVPALLEACAGAGRTLTVYAAGAGGEENEGEPEGGEEEPQASGTAIPEAEDGSGVVAADPSQYFMVYAINQDGVIGFYLYDTSEATYQRYVQVDSGEGTTVERYRSSAQRRLVVIAVLAVALVVCLFVMINLIIRQRDHDDYEEDEEDEEEDDEMEQMRRRVARKEKSHIRTGRRELNYLMDDDDDEDDDEDEDDDNDGEPDWEHMEIGIPQARRVPQKRYEEPVPIREPQRKAPVRLSTPTSSSARQPASAARPSAPKAPTRQPASSVRQPLSRTPAQRPAAQKPAAQKPAPAKRTSRPDLDEDFEFEFLDI